MNRKEAIEVIKEAQVRRLGLIDKKNQDYANESATANFEVKAAIHLVLKEHNMPIDMTTPVGVAIDYQITKLCRRLNLYKQGVTPQNESIIDTLDDAANYVDLEMICFMTEAEQAKQATEIMTIDRIIMTCTVEGCERVPTMVCKHQNVYCAVHAMEVSCPTQSLNPLPKCPFCSYDTLAVINDVENTGLYHECPKCGWNDKDA